MGILIDVFAFASGLAGYVRARLVKYHAATRLLPFVAVFAIVGAFVGKNLPPNLLEIALAAALFVLAVAFLGRERSVHFVDHPLHPTRQELERATWTDWWQDIEKKPSLFLTSSLGGLSVGLVSAGIGEVNAYNFVRRMKMDPAFAAGTSVFIIAGTVLLTTLFNLSFFAVADPQDLLVVAQIAIWAVPGVILGAQLGVRTSKRIDRRKALLTCPRSSPPSGPHPSQCPVLDPAGGRGEKYLSFCRALSNGGGAPASKGYRGGLWKGRRSDLRD